MTTKTSNGEMIWVCPGCGRVHRTNRTTYFVFMCHRCGAMMHINDFRSANAPVLLTKDEIKQLLSENSGIDMPDYRFGDGIGVPMLNGKDANLYIDGKFFFMDKDVSMSYILLDVLSDRKGLPASMSIVEMLSCYLDPLSCTVDYDKLQSRLGKVSYDNLVALGYIQPNGSEQRADTQDMEDDGSYAYYTHKKLGLPVYICRSKNREKFLADVKAAGLDYRTVVLDGVETYFAIDIWEDNGQRYSDKIINDVIADITNCGFYEEILATRETEPFPEERTFRICSVWEVWGSECVTSRNFKEACKSVLDGQLPTESNYCDNTHRIDFDASGLA